jgi:hypothetical protein
MNRKAVLAIALLALGAVSCKRYNVVERPTAPMGHFSRITIGKFSYTEYMEQLKGTERYAKYLPVAAAANDSVRKGVIADLSGWQGAAKGPVLEMTAVMDDFATGSGATRALAVFGLVPSGMGQGKIAYGVTLRSNNTVVASYDVTIPITGGSKGAYEAMSNAIASFIDDNR